ncbi:MAG: fused MFS/spermidine synthase [Candidatus Lambdaproteobacteria bacterium]|nr:fused MFS/spermidine synthase [Candidatus Lambdaproteobacteria bacterium]
MFEPETTLCEMRKEGLTVQVVQRGEQVELRFGNRVTQSAWSREQPDRLVLEYTRAMLVGFLFAPAARRILHIGLGAGSIPRFIHRYWPEAQQRIVELHPEVVEVAFRYFDLPVSARLDVVQGDGAEHLRLCRERYDLLFLDAFHAEGVPHHLEARTFFDLVRERLEPGGWLVNNVWGSDRANLRRVVANLRLAFPSMYAVSVRAQSNVILYAGCAEPPPQAALERRAEALAGRMPLDFDRLGERLYRFGAVPAVEGVLDF